MKFGCSNFDGFVKRGGDRFSRIAFEIRKSLRRQLSDAGEKNAEEMINKGVTLKKGRKQVRQTARKLFKSFDEKFDFNSEKIKYTNKITDFAKSKLGIFTETLKKFGVGSRI